MLTRKLSAETPELSSVAAECRRTGEPVCVTENGEVFEAATDEDEDEEIYDDPLYIEDQPAKKLRIKIELKDSEPLV